METGRFGRESEGAGRARDEYLPAGAAGVKWAGWMAPTPALPKLIARQFLARDFAAAGSAGSGRRVNTFFFVYVLFYLAHPQSPTANIQTIQPKTDSLHASTIVMYSASVLHMGETTGYNVDFQLTAQSSIMKT